MMPAMIRGLAAPGFVALAVLAGGCASNAPRSVPSTAGQPVINAPRSERGNPNFYEVLGRRYHVMPSADGFRETGIASWYGRDFHGRSTSSGERYDMFALTAAHKTLPLPTWVEVTNRNNGKRVIVKVNDRGPFVDNRVIDLSYAAALELDMIGTGTAPVVIRALGVPAAPPPPRFDAAPSSGAIVAANLTPSQPVNAVTEKTFVQIGAFAEEANASRVLAELRRAGLADVHVHAPATAGGVHRVHVGPLTSEREFDLVRGKLRALGFADTHLVLERF
jgi:peptidoglycan lytic transglycosylase